MKKSIIILFLSFHFCSGTALSQNYFVDPGFDEPIPMPNSITECQYSKGETFDEASKLWERSNNGSPDILISRQEYCPKHMDKIFFTS
ncbi:MAG: hypothetical protein ACI86M_003917 [Saprospiraceae bacterium]|jgi:hypothetical protein